MHLKGHFSSIPSTLRGCKKRTSTYLRGRGSWQKVSQNGQEGEAKTKTVSRSPYIKKIQKLRKVPYLKKRNEETAIAKMN